MHKAVLMSLPFLSIPFPFDWFFFWPLPTITCIFNQCDNTNSGSIGHVNIGIIFYCIGNSQWFMFSTQLKFDWFFNTHSKVLQADWLILESNENFELWTLNINMPYTISQVSSCESLFFENVFFNSRTIIGHSSLLSWIIWGWNLKVFILLRAISPSWSHRKSCCCWCFIIVFSQSHLLFCGSNRTHLSSISWNNTSTNPVSGYSCFPSSTLCHCLYQYKCCKLWWCDWQSVLSDSSHCEFRFKYE